MSSSSIFFEKLRSGDAGERDNVSVRWALALVFLEAVICFPGFPGCFPKSRPWVLSLGAVVERHSLSVIQDFNSRFFL